LSYDLMLPLASLPFPNIDPVIVRLGPIAIHWYGVGYIVGILFGWWYSKRLVSNGRLWPAGQAPLKPEAIDDFLVWAAVGVVVGGRTGYVLFYDLGRFLQHPEDIIAVWQGGMSFHGGLLGTIIAMILFAWRRKLPVWSLFDVVSAGVPVGLGLVRLCNFINGELWGKLTSVPWAVEFPNGGPFPRHPTQIYEALLEGLVLFVLLRILTHRFLKLASPGFVSGMFVAGYGAARIFVEFFREPDQQLGYLYGGWLTMGMVLSAPMVLAGLWAALTARPAAAEPARA
jgi:phosphatidylglycerol:prolipoprotein diacylglycerol transferase